MTQNNLFFSSKEFKNKAWVKDKKIYKEAEKNPVKFWEKLAAKLFWFKKWKKSFVHNPPYSRVKLGTGRLAESENRPYSRTKLGTGRLAESENRPYFQWFADGKINITENIFEKNLLGWEKIKNKTAVIWEPEPTNEEPKKLTYEELFKQVCKFANALKKLGVKKGDRVGIYLPMIPEAIISVLACARIGAVHTVIFSAFSPAALKIRLQDTGAKILITADGYYRRGRIIDLKKSADHGTKETKVKKVVVIKRAGNKIFFKKTRDLWWHELLKKENDYCKPAIMDAGDLLFLLATSGSTGRPKQTMHACGGYAVQAYWTGKWIFDFHQNDIFWCTADLGWVTGHTYGCYSPLLNGICFLFFEGAPDWPKPDRWAQIIEKYGVSIFYTAPTAIRMFEKYGEKIIKKYKFKKLRVLGTVGEPIDEDAWQWYFKNVGKSRCPIVDTWWQTETGGILISSLPGVGPFKPAFVGLPFPGIKFDILNEQGKSCKIGEQGNLVILPPFAPGLLQGLYKNPKKYKETYWSQYGNKAYFTSDGAIKDKQGLIRIVGRVDDVLKVAGHRITTGELENAVAKHPEITECAVIGIPDAIKGEVPIIFIVSKKIHKIGFCLEIKQEIIEQIKKEIGPIALPKEIYMVEDLPKTRSGKIMRRILKKLFIAEAPLNNCKANLTGQDLGDLSTLSNPETVEKIKKIIQQK